MGSIAAVRSDQAAFILVALMMTGNLPTTVLMHPFETTDTLHGVFAERESAIG